MGASAVNAVSVDGQPPTTPTTPVPPAPPEDPEVTKAKNREAVASAEKAEAEAKKAALESEKAATEQSSPAPASTRPEGKVEIGADVGLVADLLAHSLLDEGVGEVAAELLNGEKIKDDSRVLLVCDRELAVSDWPHELVSASLDASQKAIAAAEEGLKKLGEPAPGQKEPETGAVMEAAPVAAIAGISAAVGGIADIVGWLRADYSIASRKATIGDSALLASLANHLIGAERTIDVDGFSLLEGSPIINSFTSLLAERSKLAAASAKVNAARVERAVREREERVAALKEVTAKLAGALAGKEDASQADKLIARESELRDQLSKIEESCISAAAAVTTANAVVKSFDELATSLTAAPAAGGRPPLLAAALRERLHGANARHTHVLYANVESTAGEIIAKRSLFKGASLRYIGGAQVTFLLFDMEKKKITAADTRPVLGSMKFSLKHGQAGGVDKIPLKATL